MRRRWLGILIAVAHVNCFADRRPFGGDEDTATTDDPPMTGSPTDGSPTTGTPTNGAMTDGAMTDGAMTTDAPATTGGPSTTGDPTGDGSGFAFADEPFDAYTQIDRHGAVEAGTAAIAASQGLGFGPNSDIAIRDAYNASNPIEDAGGMWIPEIVASVTFFHDALDDDLMNFGIVPATLEESLMQAGPVIVPDTIKYDPNMPTAYPNGRRLEDQAVDITLAAVLLQLSPNQPLSLFADIPLNPATNDVEFRAEFPYLAAPHAP
jgi:hypothetical protein